MHALQGPRFLHASFHQPVQRPEELKEVGMTESGEYNEPNSMVTQ
jgi:hypothetical protein